RLQAVRGRSDGGHDQRRPVLRGRPGGGHDALGSTGGPTCGPSRRGDRGAGAREPRDRQRLGLLGPAGRRGPASRRRRECAHGAGWGFSGLQAAEAVHGAAVLGGRPVAALRVSGADARPRHRGLSHHSSTTYGRATLAPVLLPLLDPTAPEYSWFHASVSEQV